MIAVILVAVIIKNHGHWLIQPFIKFVDHGLHMLDFGAGCHGVAHRPHATAAWIGDVIGQFAIRGRIILVPVYPD